MLNLEGTLRKQLQSSFTTALKHALSNLLSCSLNNISCSNDSFSLALDHYSSTDFYFSPTSKLLQCPAAAWLRTNHGKEGKDGSFFCSPCLFLSYHNHSLSPPLTQLPALSGLKQGGRLKSKKRSEVTSGVLQKTSRFWVALSLETFINSLESSMTTSSLHQFLTEVMLPVWPFTTALRYHNQ